MDPYATHLEALVETAMTTRGSILELGCGNYSTPILMAIARSQGRPFVSQSSNPEWAVLFGSDVVNWDTWKPSGRWGMVFLDNEEHTLKRYERLGQLTEVTDVIVLHDANNHGLCERNGWRCTFYTKHKPHTAVLKRAA